MRFSMKLLVYLGVAAFFTIAVINNISDYSHTIAFVQHTLSMDTTKHNAVFMWRALLSPLMQHIVFLSIIILQLLIAMLIWFGLIGAAIFRKIPNHLTRALEIANMGLIIGFALYALGFITIAGQWFMMRESTLWNVQNAAFCFMTLTGLSFLIVNHSSLREVALSVG